jgi:hypothetical protein
MARCRIGKSCGATCIQQEKKCLIDLPESLAAALSRVAKRLYQRQNSGNLLDTPAKVIKWIEKTTPKLLEGGFGSSAIGGLGQYGKPTAPVWFIGLEGAAKSKHLFFGDRGSVDEKLIERYNKLGYSPPSSKNGKDRDENKMLDSNRLLYINALRDHMNMNTAVEKKAKQMGFETKDLLIPIIAEAAAHPKVSIGKLLEKIKEAPEGISSKEIESWKSPAASYAMKAKKLAEGLKEKEVALFNISDLVRPGVSSFPIKDFLQENGVNTKTFANGVYNNDKAWYAASAKAKSQKIVDSIAENKPKLVYIAGQNRTGPQGELFSQVLSKAGVKPQDIKIESKNSHGAPVLTTLRYGVITQPDGQKTVVAWGMHLTGTSGSWTETEKFLLQLVDNKK